MTLMSSLFETVEPCSRGKVKSVRPSAQGCKEGVSEVAPHTVGQAAQATGLSAKAIRLYERKSLLPQAKRTDAGYRLFTDDDLAVLGFIRQAKKLGLTLPEIKDTLDLQRGGAAPCGRVTQMLDDHIADIDRTIDDLRRLRENLFETSRTARTAQPHEDQAVVCRIIESQQDAYPT